MALAARAALVDIVAKLEVYTKDHGCILDLSAILDASICPTLDIFLPKPHHQEDVDDGYICVTPTPYLDSRGSKPQYTQPEWCKKSTIDVDLVALVNLGYFTKDNLAAFVQICLDLDIDIDIHLFLDLVANKRSALPEPVAAPLLGLDVDVDVDVDVEVDLDILSLDLDVDLDLEIILEDKRRVRHARKHYVPKCGKKIPDNTPGCHKTTAHNAADCLAKCHKRAMDLTLDAKAKVGNLVEAIDCGGISFDHGLTVSNCLVANVDLAGIVLIDAEIDTLIRL